MPAPAAIPVHRLGPRHAPAVARHLLRLDAEDRRLRFGRPMGDEALRAYAAGIDFERDRLFGIFGAESELAGVAHLAMDDATGQAELGLSVDAAHRGRGYGSALLRRAVLHAANRGYRALYMHCLADNAAMLHLARKAGLRTVVSAGEADAWLALDRARHGGALREALEDQFALIDHLLRQQHAWFSCLPRPDQAAANRASVS
ncbi:MAG: GNAT family N-acetyltransferase [Burkholderiales bacterium]|nr:GNAT family N-acetyltransferase [Burkholderiales bacterium]